MKTKYVLMSIVLMLAIIWVSIYIYYPQIAKYRQEQEKIAIDEHNFSQLEKIKWVLNHKIDLDYSFYWYQDFNKQFNQEITPIKNCYFLVDRNSYFKDRLWWWGYIFWFQLESNKYIEKYESNIFAYPEYNLPEEIFCAWWCSDVNRDDFELTIMKPCEENK